MFILTIVIVQRYRQGICRETFSPGFSKENMGMPFSGL